MAPRRPAIEEKSWVLARVIESLSPTNKQLAEQFIAMLAQREGIEFGQTDLPEPAQSIPLWVNWLKNKGHSPLTIKLYKRAVEHYLADDPRPTPLSIQAYVVKRLEAGISEARVNSEQAALKSFFKYLHKFGLWGTNPCADMEMVQAIKKEVECPTDEEIKTLLSYTLRRHKDEIKFKTMFFLLFTTGLRIHEACSLKKRNIDYGKLEIKVLGKGNKERTVPIQPLIAGLLKGYIEQNPMPDSPYVFAAKTRTGYWDESGFWRAITLACKRTGLRHLTAHKFRHYFATRTLEDGAKAEVISRILGHSSVAITLDIYRHVKQAEAHEEANKHNPLGSLNLTKLLPEHATPNGDAQVIEGEFKEV